MFYRGGGSLAAVGEWWDYIPGARVAYEYVTGKLAEWRDAGAQVPAIGQTAAVIAARPDITPTQRAQAVAIRDEAATLAATFREWNPKIEGAITAIRGAVGLGITPVVAAGLLITAAAIVGVFLTRRSAAERALMDLMDTLPVATQEAIARDLAAKLGSKGSLEALSDLAKLGVVAGLGYLALTMFGRGRRGA